ncbi:MAG TPA: 4Fe-4S binding protein [Collinsella ihuae]|uniref:4Fe-4S binding protein n=1 Tax=Collinsella ihumii TaxID=1720204 RepID=A0A921LQQ1_9ACTN|nr:4Fe-4S binding protein [Collinsella ihumii]
MRNGKFTPRRGFTPPDNTPYRYRDGSRMDASPGYHPHVSTRFRNWGAGAPAAIAKRELPELYRDRSECCGCTACAAACPRDAIAMESDEEGFAYPVVDAALCIRCRRCMDVCVFKAALVERWHQGVRK